MARIPTSWIVIADGARARIVARKGRNGPLEPVARRESEAARKPTRELGAERPGRTFESADGARHAMEPPVDWQRFEKRKFADRLARLLEKANRQGAFDRLVLIAPPRALGDLRARLAPALRAKLSGELAKDLTGVAIHDLPGHLDDLT